MFDVTVRDGITADLEAITRRLTGEQRTLGRTIAKVGRKAILASVRSRRGTLSFSGMGTKLGAQTRVIPSAAQAVVFIDAVPAGAWTIAEHGRAAVVPRRRKALKIGTGFAMSADATTGRAGLWAGAAAELDRVVVDELETAYDRAYGVNDG